MSLTDVEYKQPGRPSASPKTVRVLPTGVLRLSPDLCTTETFTIAADKAKKQLVLRPNGPFKLWYSSPDSKSGYLTAMAAFTVLELPPEDVAGEYPVERVKGGFVITLKGGSK